MYKLTIKVTRDILERSSNCATDGENGEGYGSNCAIALAVREIFPTAWVYPESIKPFNSELNIYEDDEDEIKELISLPEEARRFIVQFDAFTPKLRTIMRELEFEVEVPDRVIEKLVSIDEIKEILKTSKTLELNEC